MDYFQLAALVGGLVSAFAGLPQIIKLIKLKRSEEISLIMYGLVLVTQVTWIAYGFYKNDYALIVPNVVAGSLVITIIFLVVRYRNAKASN